MPTIAIVGRVNVGKSTLFNRLTETTNALVSPIPGTTRDRNYGACFWRGLELTIIDTGGLTEETPKQSLEAQVKKQVLIAVQEADLILFVVDGKEGIMKDDEMVSLLLKKTKINSKKPVLLTVNKIDKPALATENTEQWRKLGFGAPFFISAATGSGTGDLLDEIVRSLSLKEALINPALTKVKPFARIAILGKPNVGKSSLLNAMLGEERMIVNEMPFTTRVPQDTLLNYQGAPLLLIDTAGIRKKAKVSFELEKIGVQKTLLTLQRTDCALLVLDAFQEGLGKQDMTLGRLVAENKKSAIIVVNKIDLKEKQEKEKWQKEISRAFPHLSFAPILFVSAKQKQHINQILEQIMAVAEERKKIIPQNSLNAFLQDVTALHETTIYTKRRQKDTKKVKITSIKQLRYDPPVFLLEKNIKDPLPEGFEGFIEKRFRQAFGFTGTPIEFRIRKQDNKIAR